MIKTGLVSVSFRKLSVEQIIKLVKQNNLKGIEWGGDIHVPHGDIIKAREVRKMTEDAGLEVAAYGSYYRLGCNMNFYDILKTAKELNAPIIRVWAGKKGSKEADSNWWNKIIDESRKIADMAYKADIKVAYEYHTGTLTDTNQSALRLLKEVDNQNICTFWQPPNNLNENDRLNGLKGVINWVSNVHVFHWINGTERCALEEGTSSWKKYLKEISNTNKDHYAMLEFVKDDDINQFIKDAQTLNELVKICNK